MSQLKILRASAGSGKTYRITREYIHLLFENAWNYRHILAVTFTNKATEEMKSRILNELHKLAIGQKSSYHSSIRSTFNLSDHEIHNHANYVLNHILHDYSRFSIETIDSFFQRVIRSFIRELGLYSTYAIELDQSRILQMSVDRMLDGLDRNKALKEWLIRFTEEKIEKGQNWRLGSNIEGLGKELFREEYRYFESSISVILSDKNFLKEYLDKITTIIESSENSYARIGKKADVVIGFQNLTIVDFSYGKNGVAGFLEKIRNEFKEPGSRVRNAIDNVNGWYTKKSEKKEEITEAFHLGLNKILAEAVNFYDNNIQDYSTAQRIRENIFVLGILSDLSSSIKEYTHENNLFMLADSARLLNIIIENSDAPFIYEKIGSFFRHFMIDEFQDTSRMQWENFKPLIKNSLSENNTGLIVGDVKQSIYRWRNGDWKLLARQIENDFQNLGISRESLDHNWRSLPGIIQFNNSLFHRSSHILQQSFNNLAGDGGFSFVDDYFSSAISDAYADALQLIPANQNKDDNNNGKVKCRFFTAENYEEESLQSLAEDIEQLQTKGFPAGKIAILVRKSSEGKKVANYLFRYKNSSQAKPDCNYNFISDESLYLKNSLAISIIIAVMKYLLDPDEALYKEQIRYFLNSPESRNANVKSNNSCFSDPLDKNPILELFFEEAPGLKRHSLYALSDAIIRLFKLNKNEKYLPFLFAFQDLVFDFMQKEQSGLSGFIDWWTEEGVKKSIPLDPDQDAIRLLTIHKAKGLEFDCVLIPFCNWELDPGPAKGNIIWCRPGQKPFDDLPTVPVKYSGRMESTLFAKEYFVEKLHAFIDNINLLYVSFTRAKKVLISHSELPEKKNFKKISDLMFSAFSDRSDNPDKTKNTIVLSDFWDNNLQQFEYGDWPLQEKQIKNKNLQLSPGYQSEDISDRLQLRLSSKGYYLDLIESEKQKNRGVILHELFSRIKTIDDIPFALDDMVLQGKISTTESRSLLNEVIEKTSKHPVSDWFSGKWDVRTEDAIISPSGLKKIPDRVMIGNKKVIVVDYKFGNKNDQLYGRQVKAYKNLIKQMGYTNIEAYLWYYAIDETIRV